MKSFIKKINIGTVIMFSCCLVISLIITQPILVRADEENGGNGYMVNTDFSVNKSMSADTITIWDGIDAITISNGELCKNNWETCFDIGEPNLNNITIWNWDSTISISGGNLCRGDICFDLRNPELINVKIWSWDSAISISGGNISGGILCRGDNCFDLQNPELNNITIWYWDSAISISDGNISGGNLCKGGNCFNLQNPELNNITIWNWDSAISISDGNISGGNLCKGDNCFNLQDPELNNITIWYWTSAISISDRNICSYIENIYNQPEESCIDLWDSSNWYYELMQGANQALVGVTESLNTLANTTAYAFQIDNETRCNSESVWKIYYDSYDTWSKLIACMYNGSTYEFLDIFDTSN